MSGSRNKSKVLLIGWDAADWKVIRPLLAAGQMPHLASLIERGVSGNHCTLYPALSPMLWTSIATGKRPPKHGVLGFSEPAPGGHGVRPVSVLSRKTKAVWNILAQEGLRSVVVGWWPSHPAEPIPGAMVSEHFRTVPDAPDATLPLPFPDSVHPSALAYEIADLRVSPWEIPFEVLGLFVPKAAEIDQTKEKSLHDLAKILAETLTIHAVATDLIERGAWDFAAVYFDAIDHASHRFMRYHPPRQPGVEERDHQLYKDVVASFYRHHDGMLGRYIELAGPDTHILVISDHGFHSDSLRPQWIPCEPAGPATEHRKFGIFVMAGPGIRKGETIHTSSILDVTPTILTLFGLPVGRDMDGTPQVQAWETPPVVSHIPSWDSIPGADGMHPPDRVLDARAAAAQLDQLIALGYVEPLPGDTAGAVRQTVREIDYNLARSLADGGQVAEALPILERLWEEWPDQHRFGLHLLDLHQGQGRIAERGRVLEKLRERGEHFAQDARRQLAGLTAELSAEENDADPITRHSPAFRRKNFHRRHLVELSAGLNLSLAELSQSVLEGDRESAGRLLIPLLERKYELPPPLASFVSRTLVLLGRMDEAEPIVEHLAAIDPENAAHHLLRAEIFYRQGKWQDAADAAADSLGLVYFQPAAHMLLARALRKLNRPDEALNELLVVLRQNPAHMAALDALGEMVAGNPDIAFRIGSWKEVIQSVRRKRHEACAEPPAAAGPGLATYDFTERCARPPSLPEAPQRSDVIVVSGLPRSGTSMLMRVLEAGGIPLLTDGRRAADENNRLGYYEFEPVKRLAREAFWVGNAAGKAVKVVAPLLRYLPLAVPVSLLVIHRPIAQVLASQSAMIARLGTAAPGAEDALLARQFVREMNGLAAAAASRPAWRVLDVSYEAMLANPRAECDRIARFLGRRFDAGAAINGVDASQRRFA